MLYRCIDGRAAMNARDTFRVHAGWDCALPKSSFSGHRQRSTFDVPDLPPRANIHELLSARTALELDSSIRASSESRHSPFSPCALSLYKQRPEHTGLMLMSARWQHGCEDKPASSMLQMAQHPLSTPLGPWLQPSFTTWRNGLQHFKKG